MQTRGYQRISTENYGYQWKSLEFWWFIAISVDIHGEPVLSMGMMSCPRTFTHRLSIGIRGCPWISMDIKFMMCFEDLNNLLLHFVEPSFMVSARRCLFLQAPRWMVRGMFFAYVQIRRRFTILTRVGVWGASETLILLRFSFGFWCFSIARGLSWCWNGVPINCGPVHMAFARIFYRAYPPVLVIYHFDVGWPCISRSRQ